MAGGPAREAALRSAGSSVRTLADPKISSTTSRHCLPVRKGLNGSASSLIPCQKVRSASVKKGTSDSGGNDGAQEMSAAARSGTIHRLRPASTSLSAASLLASQPPVRSHVAALNASTMPVASRPRCVPAGPDVSPKGRVLRIRDNCQRDRDTRPPVASSARSRWR